MVQGNGFFPFDYAQGQNDKEKRILRYAQNDKEKRILRLCLRMTEEVFRLPCLSEELATKNPFFLRAGSDGSAAGGG